MMIFSTLISYCFEVIPCQTKSLFIGLLLGSIYVLAKKNKKESHNRLSEYITFFICFMIGLALIYLESIIHFSTEYTPNEFSKYYLLICGFLMSIGIVVPGVSSTVILMFLGVYSTYLSAISIANMNVLLPMIIGCGIGSILFMKLIKILLNKFHSQTIFGIIGFSLGSVLILYPTYFFNLESLIGIMLLIVGFIIGNNIK